MFVNIFIMEIKCALIIIIIIIIIIIVVVIIITVQYNTQFTVHGL